MEERVDFRVNVRGFEKLDHSADHLQETVSAMFFLIAVGVRASRKASLNS